MNATLDAPLIETHDMTETKAVRTIRTQTTLFGLVAALQDTADPDDDAAVIATMAALSQSGRLRLCIGVGNEN